MGEVEEEPTIIKSDLETDAPGTVVNDSSVPEMVEAAQALPERMALYDLSQAGCLFLITLLVTTVLGTVSLGLANLSRQADNGVQTGEPSSTTIFMILGVIVLATILILVMLGTTFIERRWTMRSN